MQSPDRREIYYPPQILYGPDGERSVLFGTGGSERSGALYVISITDLLERDVSKVNQTKYEIPKLKDSFIYPSPFIDCLQFMFFLLLGTPNI